jgi:hypothetical protein
MDIKFEDKEQDKIVPEFVYADMSEDDKKFAVDVANEARSNETKCDL